MTSSPLHLPPSRPGNAPHGIMYILTHILITVITAKNIMGALLRHVERSIDRGTDAMTGSMHGDFIRRACIATLLITFIIMVPVQTAYALDISGISVLPNTYNVTVGFSTNAPTSA